jgi:hypothetical protein
MKPELSVNICRPTLRGAGDCPVENSWFPLWLLNRHFQLKVENPPRLLFYGDVGHGEHLLYPADTIRIFLTGENIQANWAEADYALTHERVWNERHWRAPLWRHFYDPGYTHVERDFHVVQARVDRFCNFIYSNDRAQERIEFFHKLNARKPVDSCGRVLNNIGGPVADKRAYLARCKFTIAFENESHPGYATEKIIEPLLMGSIPIYWGDPGIEEDFNPDCLINVHRFRTFDDVIQRVLEIDADVSLWQQYVSAPLFRDNRLPEVLTNDAYQTFVQRINQRGPQLSAWKRSLQKCSFRGRRAYASIAARSKQLIRKAKTAMKTALTGK